MHAGISNDVLDHNLSIEETNRLARLPINPSALLASGIAERRLAAALESRSGPLWYNGYFKTSSLLDQIRAYRGTLQENSLARGEVERALRTYGCERMAIGHTYMRGIHALFGGKVIAICTMEGGADVPGPDIRAQILLIERGRLVGIGVNGERQPILM